MVKYNMFSVFQAQSLIRSDLCKFFLCRSTFSVGAYSTGNIPPAYTYNAIFWPEDGIENLDGYYAGGYHPTYINDEFSTGRYRVIHKLGYGSYSTVWLGRDQEEQRYVALKIATAGVFEKSIESKILQHLRAGNVNHPGRKFVSSLLDEFSFRGPNGHHLCPVTEVGGCSIAESKENSPSFMFLLGTTKGIAAQVTMGLAYVHFCGVGDGEIYGRFGEPFEASVSRIDKRPIGPEAPPNQVENCTIKITGLGSSFFFGKEPSTLHTPTVLYPPEIFFHKSVSSSADIWTLGCTLYDILGETPLFETWADDPDGVIGEMVSTLGKLPTRWWQQWEKRPEFFLEDGTWNPDFNRIQSPGYRPLEQRLWQMRRGETPETCEFDETEMRSLQNLLRAIAGIKTL